MLHLLIQIQVMDSLVLILTFQVRLYSKQDFQQNGKIVSKKFCIFASFSLKTFHFLVFFRRKKKWENFTKENFCKMSHFFPKFSFARNPNSKAPYFCVQTSNSGPNLVEQSTFLDTSDLCECRL